MAEGQRRPTCEEHRDRNTSRRAYLRTFAPLSPVRHCTLTGTVQATLLRYIRDFSLITQCAGHSLPSVVLSSAHTPTQKTDIFIRGSPGHYRSDGYQQVCLTPYRTLHVTQQLCAAWLVKT